MDKIIMIKEEAFIAKQKIPYVIAFEMPIRNNNHLKETLFFNNITGKISYSEEDCCSEKHCLYFRSIKPNGYDGQNLNIRTIDLQYEEAVNLMAIIVYELKITETWDTIKPIPILFKEVNRIYVDYNKKFYNPNLNENGEYQLNLVTFPTNTYRLLNSQGKFVKFLNDMNYEGETANDQNKHILEELEKLGWDWVEIENKCTKIDSFKKFDLFINKPCYLSEFPEINLKQRNNIAEDIKEGLKKNSNIYNRLIYKYGFIEKLDETNICIRIYHMDFLTEKTYEFYRILISSNQVAYYILNSIDRFRKMTSDILLKDNIVIFNEDFTIYENTKLQYVSEMLNNLGPIHLMDGINRFFKYPFIEKLYKSEFKQIAIDMMVSKHDLKKFCKIIKKDNPDIYKIFDMNRYQSEQMILFIEEFRKKINLMTNKEIRHSELIIKILSNILKVFQGKEDMDNHTFLTIFNVYKEVILLYVKYELNLPESKVFEKINQLNDVLKIWQEQFSNEYRIRKIPHVLQIFKIDVFCILDNLDKNNSSRNNTISIYRDTLNMISKLKSLDSTNYKFDHDIESYEVLVQRHEEVIAIYNEMKDIIENAIYEKAFAKRKEIWKNYCYEDDQYIITYPEVASDIAAEGYHLKHCVKSYISQVAAGSTNIFFLRKKEDILKSFFTIELLNNKTVNQIHGNHNINIRLNSEEFHFIEKWKQEKEITIRNNIYS